MSTFTYTKLEKSIQDTSFEYITNLDDYKALSHILDVIVMEKAKKPIIQGVFHKVSAMLKNTIVVLEKMIKSGEENIIDLAKLQAYAKSSATKKILLVRNEEYNSFASYVSGFEDADKIETVENKTVLYNVGQLETSGSISVVPTNANVFLSSMLYAYALLFSNQFYDRQNTDVLVQIAKVFYTVILSNFGKKSGLLVGARREKEFLFLLVASFTYAMYASKERQTSDKLKNFLMVAASQTGTAYIKEYLGKISNIDLKVKSDAFSPTNYNSLFNLTYVAKQLELLTISESEIKIQWFRILSIYGVMALENYARLVAYLVGTYIPNSYFTSALKVYNQASYDYLVEYFLKELFSYK